MARRSRPFWWEWDLELSEHVLDRMKDRGFTALDLRGMLGRATSISHDIVPGRWVARTRLRRKPWELIIAPVHDERILLVITAYCVSMGH